MNSYAIAKHLRCSATLIRNRLHTFGIKTRSIQEAKALTRPKYKRTAFSNNQKEKAYMIGFRLGDLYISKTHPNSPTIRVSTNTTKQEQRDLMRTLFAKYGHYREYPVDRYGATSIRIFVNNSFNFLLRKGDFVESWILQKKNLFLSFLAGYIDAEGSFISKENTAFTMQTQDKNIMLCIAKELNKYGVECMTPTISRKAGTMMGGVVSNKDVWSIRIYNRKNLLALIMLLKNYIMHKKRRNDMLILLKRISHVGS